MFTSWLVPLGKDFEMALGVSCAGYGSRTHEDLMGGKENVEIYHTNH